MSISVSGVSSETLIPLVSFELKPDGGESVASRAHRVLAIVHQSGSGDQNQIHEISSLSEAKAEFGDGEGYHFVKGFFGNYEKTIYVIKGDDLSQAIASVGDEPFDLVATTFRTGTDLTAFKNWTSSRFTAINQLSTQVFIAVKETVNNLSAQGNGLDDAHLTIFENSTKKNLIPGTNNLMSDPQAEAFFLGAVLGTLAGSADIDPSLPFQRLLVRGLIPPSVEDRFSTTERNLLLGKGVSTFTYGTDQVWTERVRTTYKKTLEGNDDETWKDLNTLLTASYLRKDWVTYLRSKYPRMKFGDDGGSYASTSGVITPRTIKAEYINKLSQWEEDGLVQNVGQMAKDIVVEKEGDTCKIMAPIHVIDQLRQIVGVIKVRN